ncbi:MAG: hypothetical protein AAF682_18565 [Planctomycetota bacterium]
MNAFGSLSSLVLLGVGAVVLGAASPEERPTTVCSGVVADSDGDRRPGIEVWLVMTEGGGGILAKDDTNLSGLHLLSSRAISQATVDEVFVVVSLDQYNNLGVAASPVPVTLGPVANGARCSKAGDLILLDPLGEEQRVTPDEAVERIRVLLEMEAAYRQIGVSSSTDAAERLESRVREVLLRIDSAEAIPVEVLLERATSDVHPTLEVDVAAQAELLGAELGTVVGARSPVRALLVAMIQPLISASRADRPVRTERCGHGCFLDAPEHTHSMPVEGEWRSVACGGGVCSSAAPTSKRPPSPRY